MALAMLEKLMAAGVVHRVPVGEDLDGFSLAKPAGRVRVADLIELAGHMSAGSSGMVSTPDQLEAIEQAQIHAAGEMTLGMLIGVKQDQAMDSTEGKSEA